MLLKGIKQLVVLALVLAGMWAGWRWIEDRLAARSAGGGVAAVKSSARARVASYAVERKEFRDTIEALGTVRAAESAEISAKVTETVEEILFDEGQQVEAGQLLVRLSAQEVQATLEAARAELQEHERELERLRKLVENGAAPKARLDERETLAELARRRIQEAEARLADRSIVAPFRGRLGLRRISPGALVSPGTVLVTLDQIDTVKLDFQVPEVFLAELKPGLKIEARSAAWPGRVFPGKISQVDSRVNEATRAVTVRAELDNPDLALRPGMLITAQFGRKPRQGLAVPERALVPLNRRQFVYVIDETNGVARQTEVQTGARLPGFVEMTAGVEEGMKIVADGIMGLRDGDAVEVVETFKAPAAPYNPRVGAAR